MHRVLDKNYRLQATPHKTARMPNHIGTASKKTPREARKRWRDSLDLDSSPVDAAPQLHADIFSSPIRGARTPGVSVQTPMRRGKEKDKGEVTGAGTAMGADAGLWDSDSDEGEGGIEFSPPKTMQFHVPQSRLLRTPGEFRLCLSSVSFPLLSLS